MEEINKSSIKVSKGMKGNYGYEIKLIKKENQSNEEWLKELYKLEEELNKQFN